MKYNKKFCVYIITNTYKTVLYVGVTSNLQNRIVQHKTKFYPTSFSARYNCSILVYFNEFPTMIEAIKEEKRIKGGNRKAKIMLIEKQNKEWKDLFEV